MVWSMPLQIGDQTVFDQRQCFKPDKRYYRKPLAGTQKLVMWENLRRLKTCSCILDDLSDVTEWQTSRE